MRAWHLQHYFDVKQLTQKLNVSFGCLRSYHDELVEMCDAAGFACTVAVDSESSHGVDEFAPDGGTRILVITRRQ